MFPNIINETNENVFLLENGAVVSAFNLSLIDLERAEINEVDQALTRTLSTLSLNATLRLILRSNAKFDGKAALSRAEAFAELGYVENRLFLVIEKSEEKLSSLIKKLTKTATQTIPTSDVKSAVDLHSLKSTGLTLTPVTREDFETLLINATSRYASSLSCGVNLGRSVVGIIRLVKQSAFDLPLQTLAQIKDSLPLPYEIRVSVKRLSNEKSESFLRRRSKQSDGSTDNISQTKQTDAEELLESVSLGGGKLFNFEFLILIERLSEADLCRDATEMIMALKPLGDFLFETVGAFPSYLAAQIGEEQHLPLLEKDNALALYLPIFTYGEGEIKSSPEGNSGAGAPSSRVPSPRNWQSSSDEIKNKNGNEVVIASQLPSDRTEPAGLGSRDAALEDPDLFSETTAASSAVNVPVRHGTEERTPCAPQLPAERHTSGIVARDGVGSGALAVLRRDQSLSLINLFDQKHDNYSAAIFGKSGRGKSVLTNLLTRALLNDPKVKIIKVDVGGSHSKETKLLGGEERRLTLTEPSGINPFAALASGPSEDKNNILANFLGVLLLEEGEQILSKTMRGQIEAAITDYANTRPQRPTIDDFYNHATNLPRRDLLRRWTTGGVYGNAFRNRESGGKRSLPLTESRGKRSASASLSPSLSPESKYEYEFQSEIKTKNKIRNEILIDSSPFSSSVSSNDSHQDYDSFLKTKRESASASGRHTIDRDTNSDSGSDSHNDPSVSADSVCRLRYYNFSQIFQASDPDFGQGGLAAVIAQFNLELLSAQRKGERLVFIADETPFFIERCFSFFKFSTANVRKFGGSFIIIAQKSSDVVIKGDTGILDNTATKILFSVDGERDQFAKRLKIEDEIVERIESLTSEKGKYSECVVIDGSGARTVRIQLSAEEKWRTTSSAGDNERLNSLLTAVPGLSLAQAINVLSQIEEN